MKVANKVVVVTGAGSGMGRELALELAPAGKKEFYEIGRAHV